MSYREKYSRSDFVKLIMSKWQKKWLEAVELLFLYVSPEGFEVMLSKETCLQMSMMDFEG